MILVLDNSNIVESYPGITLPLTCSFAKLAYCGVFKGLVGDKLKDEAVLNKFEGVFNNMVADYKGRMYYNINNWYALIDFLPFSKRITPIWRDMMGVQNEKIYTEKLHVFSFPQKTALYFNLIKSFLRTPADMKRLEADFKNVRSFFNENYSNNISVKELLSLFHTIEEKILKKWYVTLHNDMYAFIWTGLLKRRLKHKGTDVTRYISGIKSLESLKPLISLTEIAEKYANGADIETEMLNYIEIFGDRSPCELKLEVMTYREDPSLLEAQIRMYASDKLKLHELKDSLRHKDVPAAGFLAKLARRGIESREISRLNRSRIYGMVRRIFMRIGEIFQAEGRLADWFDIFYLKIDEIENNVGNMADTVAGRKIEYEEYEKLPAYNRLVFRDGLPNAETVKPCTFKGLGASAGRVTGEAVVLDSPNASVDVRGKIIVTKTTDPGWVFLLTMASGIIAEKGSLLSHTAIVSRELGIPAAVGVENASAAIKTGDLVTVDGDSGRIHIVQTN